jgi:hypothetical protein
MSIAMKTNTISILENSEKGFLRKTEKKCMSHHHCPRFLAAP